MGRGGCVPPRRFCRSTGHTLSTEGDFCPQHGARVFVDCSGCGTPWGVIVEKTYGSRVEHAAKFCSHCSMPAPWTTRQERIVWLSDRIGNEPGLGEAEVLELRELL